MKTDNYIFIHHSKTVSYPQAPYHPLKIFPEFSNGIIYTQSTQADNFIYGYVRDILIGLELDKEHIGTPSWNPFRGMVSPGQITTIKPNLVRGDHPLGIEGIQSMISQAAVIRPLIDYVLLATRGQGEITIADVPLQSTKWDQIAKNSGIQSMVDFYESMGIKIHFLDLRYEISHQNSDGIIVKRDYKKRDPKGYTAVDIGTKSRLMPVIEHYKRFEITDYGKGTVPKYHNREKNEYLIPNTILHSDFFINVPKLKTHRKAGLTCALKNLIGINGDKAWLAHHRRGSKKMGGDEYEKIVLKNYIKWHIFSILKRNRFGIFIASFLKRVWKFLFWRGKSFNEHQIEKSFDTQATREKLGTSEGSWYGNDTVWRCIIDLNNILIFSDKDGILQKIPQRKYFCIVDGILAGEREGPMEHTPKKAGIILGGFNPVAIDFAAAHIMGFDWRKIPQIREAMTNTFVPLVDFKPEEIVFLSNDSNINNLNLQFIPTMGWKGKIEKSFN